MILVGVCMHMTCVSPGTCIPQHVNGSQSTASGGKPLLPSRVLGSKPRSSDLCSKLSYLVAPHNCFLQERAIFGYAILFMCMYQIGFQ